VPTLFLMFYVIFPSRVPSRKEVKPSKFETEMVGDLLSQFPIESLVIPNTEAPPTHCIYLVGHTDGMLSLTVAPFSSVTPYIGQPLRLAEPVPFCGFFHADQSASATTRIPNLAAFERGYVYALRQGGKSVTELETPSMYCKTYFSFSQSHRCYTEEKRSTGCSFEEAGVRVCSTDVANYDRDTHRPSLLRRRMRRENRTILLDAVHMNHCALSEATLLSQQSGFIRDLASVCNGIAFIHSHTHPTFVRIHTTISNEIPTTDSVLDADTLQWHERALLNIYIASWAALESKTGPAYKQLLLHRLMHRAGAVGQRLPCLSAMCIVTPSAKQWMAPLAPQNRTVSSQTLQKFARGIRDHIHRPGVELDAYTSVILQILYHLQIMREVRLGHYDLHACNILVNEWQQDIDICLEIDGHHGGFELQTKYTVHFIDWDMACKHPLPDSVCEVIKKKEGCDPRILALCTSLQVTSTLLPPYGTDTGDGDAHRTGKRAQTFAEMYGIQHDEFNPISDLFCFLGDIGQLVERKQAVFFAHPDVISPSGVGMPDAVIAGSLDPLTKSEKRIAYWIPSLPLIREGTYEDGKGATRRPFVLSPTALQSPLAILLQHPLFRHHRRPARKHPHSGGGGAVTMQLFSTLVCKELGLSFDASVIGQIRLEDVWVQKRMPYKEEWHMPYIA
jgi:hypothetical protein